MKSIRVYLVLALFQLGVSNCLAKGIAVQKQQRYHSDAVAQPFIYDSVRDLGRAYSFRINGKDVVVEKTIFIDILNLPKELPANITNKSQITPVRDLEKKVGAFAEKYKKTRPLITGYHESIRKFIAEYDNGNIRYEGKWVSKDAYNVIIVNKEKYKEDLIKKIEIEKIASREREEERKKFEASQRAKGLTKYKNVWLPHSEASKRFHDDEIEAIVRTKVKNNSVYDIRIKVFQVLDSGALISVYQTKATKGHMPTTRLVYLSNIEDDLIADNEYYKGDLFYCGSHSYTTVENINRTVHEYCLSKDRAVDILTAKLNHKKSRKPSSAGATGPSVSDELPPILAGSKGSGSGFFVGQDGYIVTNDHVVKGSTKFKVYYKGKVIEAKLVTTSKALDLAVLKIDTKVQGLPIVGKQIRSGETIFALGYPQPSIQGIDVKITKGIISGSSGLKANYSQYQIDAAIQPGNSGGPVCNKNGEVVGVVVSKLDEIYVANRSGSISQNVNYAVKSSELTAFLRSNSIKYSAGSEVNGDEVTNIATSAEKSVLIIVK